LVPIRPNSFYQIERRHLHTEAAVAFQALARDVMPAVLPAMPFVVPAVRAFLSFEEAFKFPWKLRLGLFPKGPHIEGLGLKWSGEGARKANSTSKITSQGETSALYCQWPW
jgi:hypothetical protein